MALEPPPRQVIQELFPLLIVFLQRTGVALGQTAGFSGLRATSWWRDSETNRRVGGHPESQHLGGLALDIVGPQETLDRFAIEARGEGLTAIQERTHLHLQLFPAGVFAGIGAGLFV